MEFIVKRGYIFYIDLGKGIGSEQGGVRPCVIIQNDIGNKFSPTIQVVPVTSEINSKSKIPTHVKLEDEIDLPMKSMALVEQLRTVDKRRIKSFLGILSKEAMENINDAIKISAGLTSKSDEEIKRQLNKLNTAKEIVDEIKNLDGISESVISQFVARFTIEYSKLRKLCEKYKKDINDFYTLDSDIETRNNVYAVI